MGEILTKVVSADENAVSSAHTTKVKILFY